MENVLSLVVSFMIQRIFKYCLEDQLLFIQQMLTKTLLCEEA